MKCDVNCKYYHMCWNIGEGTCEIGEDCDQYKPEPPIVAFLCKDKGTEYCHHTKHIEQARNFEKVGPNMWMEKEPKRGKWTEEFDESANPFFQRRWRCSACNDYNYYGRSDFCPCCGADMRKGDAE